MKHLKKSLKLIIGLIISALFMYLAFRKVNFSQMLDAFKSANYWYLVPGTGIMFVSYWLRAWRHRFLMAPVKEVKTFSMLSALMIGYMANSFLPAHLGEFLRAYTIGKKEDVPSSTVFASIVIERIIDILSLLALMGLTIIVFPFPAWVRKSGYLFLAGVVGLFVMLILMKIYRKKSGLLLTKLTGFLPAALGEKLLDAFQSLLDGIVPLKKKSHYVYVTLLTFAIWGCYAVSFHVVLYAFSFVQTYSLPWLAALVILVMTTIGILIPSSPGYVGVYHYLCQISLGFFGVPEGGALTYAFVMHGINFFPIIVIGLIFLGLNNISLKNFKKEDVALQD